MKKRLLFLLVFTLAIINSNFAFNQDNFNYIHFYQDSQSETNKVSYELKYPDELEYVFEMNIIYNGKLLENPCKKNIQLEEGTIFSKITCEVPKLGIGEYTFEGNFYDKEGNLIKKTINKEYILEDLNAKMQFWPKEDSTTITIEVSASNPVTVLNDIPKEVIEKLTKENQNSLIKSNIPFKILEENPLISWNIDEPPAKINYTINKKISIEDQKKFQLEIKNTSTFKWLKYSIFLIILIILGFLIKPVFRKEKKNEKY